MELDSTRTHQQHCETCYWSLLLHLKSISMWIFNMYAYTIYKHAFKSISIKFNWVINQCYYQTSKHSPNPAIGKPDHHPLSLAVGTKHGFSPINRLCFWEKSTQSVDCNHKNPHMRLNSLFFTDSSSTRFCFFDWIPIWIFCEVSFRFNRSTKVNGRAGHFDSRIKSGSEKSWCGTMAHMTTHTIHAWYAYLHLVDFYGKSR